MAGAIRTGAIRTGAIAGAIRIGVVGTGLAGTLLAWRLRQTSPRAAVTLFGAADPAAPDATGVSGGLVRGFEEDPSACRDATESMAELLASRSLRERSGYHEIGSLYVLPGDGALGPLIATVESGLPGSLRVLDRAAVAARYPFRNLPVGSVGVAERRAGYLSPARLRDALLAELARYDVTPVPGGVTAITEHPGCRLADGRHVEFDLVVLATGRWTGALLAASGLPAGALRTKLIQVCVHETARIPLPSFVDGTSGLYGRWVGEGQALLGLPSDRWDVPPASADLVRDDDLAGRVAAVTGQRLPDLRVGRLLRVVTAADSYHESPGLALREVVPGRVYTFAGGSGGAVKTALAASRRAARRLAGTGPDRSSPYRPATPMPVTGRPAGPGDSPDRLGRTIVTHSHPLVPDRDAGATPDGAGVPHFHTVGVGAGPANMSVAALYDALAPHEMALFEAQASPAWHDGLLHAGVRMQTGWVKDLVSLLDPTHRLSILNYLVTTGRVFGLLGAGFDTIPRIEYNQYLEWAARQLPRVFYNTRIDRVTFDNGFVSQCGDRVVAHSDHLVLGQGTVPYIPDCFAGADSDRVILADWLLARLPSLPADPDLPLIVVGSGQTSAECVGALLGRGFRNIKWMGRRSWFAPLEDSPSANDLYRPAYQKFFLGLSNDVRHRLVSGQILTSDGISPGTLRGLYQHNYEERLRTGQFPVTIMPSRHVVESRLVGDEVELQCQAAGTDETHRGAYVVVAAGRRYAPLPFAGDLLELVDRDEHGEPVIESDYSIRWKGADRNKMFVLNRGRYVQGLVDSNLSILPIRSAIVINSIAERCIYSFHDDYVGTAWA